MRRLTALAAAAALLLPLPAAAQQPIPPKVKARIDRILKATPLIDGHNDLPEQLAEKHGFSVDGLASDGARRTQPLMTDMARLRAGRVGGQFWSVWIEGTLTGDLAIRRTLEEIDIVDRLIATYPGHLEKALTADDVVRIHRKGKVASLIGIEGGRQIGGSMAALRMFHRLGARYLTLTHDETNELGDSATDDARHDGLSPFGIEVVREMNRLGMMVDLSHAAPSTMRDAIDASRAPVIFSHSSARALNDNQRNVPDDVLRSLRDKDGVVMITFVPRFLGRAAWDWTAARNAEEARLKAYHRDSSKAVADGLAAWIAAHPIPPTPVGVVADHVEHVARVAGYDHVGIGADYDGTTYMPAGLDDVSGYPLLFAELIRRGWSDSNLARLAGGNILRVMRRAEAVARAMADVPPSLARPGAAK